MSSQVKFVTLPRAQLGLIADVIINLESSTTKKEIQANKQKIFTFIRFFKPIDLENCKASGLYEIQRTTKVDDGDILYTFWYSKEK